MNTTDRLSPDDLRTVAENYPDVDAALAEVAFTRPHYFRKSISRSPGLEVVLVCFGDLQATTLHDHGGSDCVVRCLSGTVRETTYRRAANGDLTFRETRSIGTGDLSLVEAGDFHQVANMCAAGTVLLNFYSPALPHEASAPIPLPDADAVAADAEEAAWVGRATERLREWSDDEAAAELDDAAAALAREFESEHPWYTAVGVGTTDPVVYLYVTNLRVARRELGPLLTDGAWRGFPVEVRKMGRPKPARAGAENAAAPS